MKIYLLKKVQVLPTSLLQAWEFISSPENLVKITPSNMAFQIISISGVEKLYPGQVIRYNVKVLPFLTYNWVTEITHAREPFFFVDEQRFGPYTFWHHQHRLREVSGGVEMTDEIHYAVPFGPIGRLLNRVFVEPQLNSIFNYRFNMLKNHFARRNQNIKKQG